MAITVGDKTYRNLPEQVEENANNIQRLLDIISSFGNVMRYCGSVATYDDLPTEDNQIGDVWNVLDTGNNYAWDGEGWDEISSIVDLSGYVAIIQTDGIDDESAYAGAKVGDVVIDSAGFVGIIKELEKSGSTIAKIVISGLEANNVPTTYTGNNGSWSYASLNYVTTDTDQTISVVKTFNGNIIFVKSPLATKSPEIQFTSTLTTGKIYQENWDIVISASMKIGGNRLYPINDNFCDLGVGSTNRFKDLYLGGTAYANQVSATYIDAEYHKGSQFSPGIPNQDQNLGDNGTHKWNNLYLKGVISDGTNSVSVAELAWKELDLTGASLTETYITGALYSYVITLDASATIPAGIKELSVDYLSGLGIYGGARLNTTTKTIQFLTYGAIVGAQISDFKVYYR